MELLEEGQLSRAMRTLRATGMLDITPEILEQLRAKHPARSRSVPASMFGGPYPRVHVQLTETFRRLRRRRATGVSGLRNEYLIALTTQFADARALSVMDLYDSFASSFASGDMPSWFYMVWQTSRLVALPKPTPEPLPVDAVPPARPIAIGEVSLSAICSAVIQSFSGDFATELSPQQVSIGVSGGISIVVFGLRLLLEELSPDFVVVRIDLKNAYNSFDRAMSLRRFAMIPRLAPLVPLMHALSGPQFDLLVSTLLSCGEFRRLFDGARVGDSSAGGAQGRAPSSPQFCIAIHPEVCDLDAELAIFGGCARFISDDGYAAGPAAVVFPAVARFIFRVYEALGLVVNDKLECYSCDYDLAVCPHRLQYLPESRIARASRADMEQAGLGAYADTRSAQGITVGNIPIGGEAFVQTFLYKQQSRVLSDILETRSSLAAVPHHRWSALHYCLTPEFDYWLQHHTPIVIGRLARGIDNALVQTVESFAYPGSFAHPLLTRRLGLPAREFGGGIRGRFRLIPAAFCSRFVSSAERFLDVHLPGGLVEPGFFPMLTPLFGAGAFDAGGHRFATFAARLSGLGADFFACWQGMRSEFSVPPATGPLSELAADAGRATSYRLQHLLTAQRESHWATQLHTEVMQLPHTDEVRRAWIRCDRLSTQWVPSWPSPRHRLEPEVFGEVFAAYFGLESPLVRLGAGLPIPDSRAARPRICDVYGIELANASLPGRGWDDQHDDILDVILRTASEVGVACTREPRSMFSHVLPAAVLARAGDSRLGIIPDIGARGLPSSLRGAAAANLVRIFDVKTIHREASGPGYTRSAAQTERAAAVRLREAAVPGEYERSARQLDETHYGIPAAGVRSGAVGPGPVLLALRAAPTVVGLVFGAYGEASPSVHALISQFADRGASQWRTMGARSASEARGFLVGRIRRDWGIAAARAHAQMLVARWRYVGLTREQAAAIGRPAGGAAHGGAGAGDAAVAAGAFEEGLVADAAPLLGAQP